MRSGGLAAAVKTAGAVLGLSSRARVVVVEPPTFVHFEAVAPTDAALIMLGAAFIVALFFMRGRPPATRIVRLASIGRADEFQDIFMGYLCAGILEPLVAIGSASEGKHNELIVLNVLQLLSLCAWLVLLNDAFGTSDVSQAFAMRKMSEEAAAKGITWLKCPSTREPLAKARQGLGVSPTRDSCLWFVLLCIAAACAGVVSHGDVIHSWFLICLWVVLHHLVHRGTSPWNGMGYAISQRNSFFLTDPISPICRTPFPPICRIFIRVFSKKNRYVGSFFFLSSALMPVEYCLHLKEQETLEDLDSMRLLIRERLNLDLTIEPEA